jgi:hypothetical protein
VSAFNLSRTGRWWWFEVKMWSGRDNEITLIRRAPGPWDFFAFRFLLLPSSLAYYERLRSFQRGPFPGGGRDMCVHRPLSHTIILTSLCSVRLAVAVWAISDRCLLLWKMPLQQNGMHTIRCSSRRPHLTLSLVYVPRCRSTPILNM